MKKLFFSVLFVLLMASSVLAVDSPHVIALGCTGCHYDANDYMAGITGVNNLCLTCHNPSLMTKGFLPQDIANPFNSTDLGLYQSGMKQTSHNWAAPVNVPMAGAVTPVNPAMQVLRATSLGVISCASCHGNHAASATSPDLFRFPNDSDQLCFDCHRLRNQRSALSGTHPVNFNYTGATSKVKLKPSEYQRIPVNSNPANPTSAMRLPNGKILCTTCHGVHFTDSNSRTIDGPESSAQGLLSSSQGYLLRTDLRGGTANAVNICTNCHAGKMAHNRNGQNIQCADCHAGHVDPGDGTAPNVWLVRRYMNYSAGVKLNSYRRTVFNQYTGSRSNFAGAYGVCQGCHFVPPPGGSFPSEHASTDPNICRSCHTHNTATGSFAADCTACHGFPPQQNTPGGPLGYAKTPSYDYAVSPAFKDESKTGHLAHAGSAPYAFSCFECHSGNKHATGNFQQVFISTNGTIAAIGGAVPMYNTASPGTCSNVYCHSNGAPAGGATVYKSPVWANAKGSIVGTAGECSACHDAMPATNAHTGHLNNSFACALCHAATVSSNTVIKDTSKHVDGVKDVLFSGTATIGGTGSYNNTTHTCSNLYCHSNGNQGALAYVNPSAWNSGVNYGCNGCHGTSSPIGAPDYANTGVGTGKANSHAAHAAGAANTTVCANCHFATASSITGGTLVANTKHLSGTTDVVFNPATAGATAAWDPATGTCTNIECHGGAPAQWGSTAACLTCHAFAIRGRAAIGPQFSGNSHHSQGGAITAAQCYQCHWEANSDGSINLAYHHANIPGGPVELVVYGAGARPAVYNAGATGTTAVPYTANGTRGEMAKINAHCIGCHSDKNNATQPFGDGKTPNSYAWDKASIAAKYGDTGTTPWGKYAGGNTTPKNTVTKAFSAHGNAAANQAGWNISETWPNTTGTVAVLCFDCHNSHGSSTVGATTSYASATANGGILKDTVAGKGGYAMTYQPKAGGTAAEHNLYNPGAGLCFDCHQSASSGITPWGYNSTFSASQAILGYLDTPSFGVGQFGYQIRNPYKINVSFGGHFGATSSLSATPSHAVGGLCTPCHDPHGVSPTLGSNKPYGVPLLKGTWMTSPYKEDNCTADNATYGFISGVRGEEKPRPAAGAYAAYTSSIKSYKIDQNTFTSGSITETDQQFAGLCLNCHAKQTLSNGVTHTWKDKNRVHESVKGWKTANATIKHNYTCSKCHAPHNAQLPRLMITNCLDYKHRGRVTNNPNPKLSFGYRGEEGYGSGHIPGIYSGRSNENSGGSTSGTGPVSSSATICHEGNTGSNTDQYWNVKTPWTSGAVSPVLVSPMLVAEPDAICSGSCGVQLQWDPVTNTGGGAVQYLVQVSSSSAFATVNYSSGWISGTSYTPTLANGTWYWRVQARDSVKTTTVSAWSDADSFILSLNPPPSIPLLIAEPDATCSGSCGTQLQWNPSTNPAGGALQYSVQLSSDISFATVNYSSGWITTTSYTPTLANGTWYWRVQARSAANTSLVSAWSLANSFTLSSATSATAPSAPILIAKSNSSCSSSSGCSNTLKWNASVNPSGGTLQYLVQVSSSSSFSTIKTTSNWISGTSWTATLGRGTWYWRVQARNAATTTLISPWSSTGSFVIK
ncbi:MAG: CxxxxCH/CxxCH domain-containing protein [Geobacter sp.]|nr:CxxxxCH/CxxCH domain-containing protein [Geobacter sp.]